MLHELKNVFQNEPGIFRRFFSDIEFDLYVWYENQDLIGFQLCYDKKGYQRALTWMDKSGYRHEAVETGEMGGSFKRKPILVADGVFDFSQIAEKFLKESIKMDKELSEFIYKKISEFK